jgi:hypothetical protein
LRRRKKLMPQNRGKLLISLAAILTIVFPWLADWNEKRRLGMNQQKSENL